MASKRKQNIIYSAGSLFSLPVARLRSEMGAEGFGIYIMLIELLTLNEGRLPLDYELIGFNLNIDADAVRRVVEHYDLFKIFTDSEENYFTEENIDTYQEECKSLRLRRAAAAQSRWDKAKSRAVKKPCESKGDAKINSSVKDSTPSSMAVKSNCMDNSISQPVKNEYDHVADTEQILSSEQWVAQESARLCLDQLTFREVMREFMKYTESRGISYPGRQEYLQHFTRWSVGAGLDAAMEKVNERRRARKLASQKEEERLNRLREWEDRDRNAVTPAEYIRMKGYDPTKVTNMMNVANPEWRALNPPTLPVFNTIEEFRRAVVS